MVQRQPLSSSSNKLLAKLVDNAPSQTGLDANVLLVIHVMFVARLFLTAMTISLPIPVGRTTTTTVTGARPSSRR